MKKLNKAQQIRNYMEKHPTADTKKICSALGVKPDYVYVVKSKIKSAANEANDDTTKSVLQEFAERAYREWQPPEVLPVPEVPTVDNVNHPPHYKTGGMETIDFIEAKDLGYHLGNVIKYVTRAKHKGNELEDLKKAQWYLERAIMKLHV
jgi:hypothetical protein